MRVVRGDQRILTQILILTLFNNLARLHNDAIVPDRRNIPRPHSRRRRLGSMRLYLWFDALPELIQRLLDVCPQRRGRETRCMGSVLQFLMGVWALDRLL